MLDLLTVGPQFTRPASRAAAAAIDRYLLLPRPTSAANPSVAAAAVDRRDRQTDGRTRPFCDVYSILCAPRNNAGHVAGMVNFYDLLKSKIRRRKPFQPETTPFVIFSFVWDQIVAQ